MPESGIAARKKKSSKLYKFERDIRVSMSPGWNMENFDALGVGPVLYSPRGKRSFPPLLETPRLLIARSLGRPPADWEPFHDFWLVSDRMKNVLESVDREGVAFLRCETRSLRGEAPVYWLCDIIRELDVIDEEKSNFKVLEDGTDFRRYVGTAMDSTFVFREEVIGSAHIFRARFLNKVVCSQAMKDACKAAGLKGLRFGNPYINWG
ncbi:DUF1629 domain-containing protein [Bradyrhizobium sp. NBAIM02]|uniref:imm11 family protein n=1 Tax=Bradyrhizobium sp. NBAIM02 TaxID=2793817 RepID=UPI001CD24DDC|nr:DUF1629 domain-containing protein [Bradyrhizobium sp. NBAIM02]MCA1507641.1 DUF1629 domain-containing protein [Bradyrhizobium sp. NBAIM02]